MQLERHLVGAEQLATVAVIAEACLLSDPKSRQDTSKAVMMQQSSMISAHYGSLLSSTTCILAGRSANVSGNIIPARLHLIRLSCLHASDASAWRCAAQDAADGQMQSSVSAEQAVHEGCTSPTGRRMPL